MDLINFLLTLIIVVPIYIYVASLRVPSERILEEQRQVEVPESARQAVENFRTHLMQTQLDAEECRQGLAAAEARGNIKRYLWTEKCANPAFAEAEALRKRQRKWSDR